MNTPALIAIPVLSLGLASLALAQPPATTTPASASAQIQEDDAEAVEAAKQAHRHCVRETGTRLRNHNRAEYERCLAGRGFDREDIERTGAFSLDDALRRLDPSVTIDRN